MRVRVLGLYVTLCTVLVDAQGDIWDAPGRAEVLWVRVRVLGLYVTLCTVLVDAQGDLWDAPGGRAEVRGLPLRLPARLQERPDTLQTETQRPTHSCYNTLFKCKVRVFGAQILGEGVGDGFFRSTFKSLTKNPTFRFCVAGGGEGWVTHD